MSTDVIGWHVYHSLFILQLTQINYSAFQFAPLYSIRVVEYQKMHSLYPYIRSPYLLVSPLIRPAPGHELEKISDTVGKVDYKWRDSPDPYISRITRTLDAFQHFVLMKTKECLLISDLQGNSLLFYSEYRGLIISTFLKMVGMLQTFTSLYEKYYVFNSNPDEEQIFVLIDPELHRHVFLGVSIMY